MELILKLLSIILVVISFSGCAKSEETFNVFDDCPREDTVKSNIIENLKRNSENKIPPMDRLNNYMYDNQTHKESPFDF